MKKRLFCTLLCLSLVFTAFGCKKNETSSSKTPVESEEENEIYSYTIAACLSESNSYDEKLFSGFSDCLKDYLGSENLTIKKYTCSADTPSDLVAATAVSGSNDLIFTTGKQMLTSASTATDSIPIVATGIVDFQKVLRIADNGNKAWDKTTGINVTGVSSKPSIVDQVSLMIEATENLETVGILFSPEDTEAIYQNEIFEKYLDQAGIPWKEYMIPASPAAIDDEEDQNVQILLPTKYVAVSAKSGSDNDVVSLGTDSILGINSPASTRVAHVSKYWTTGKTLPPNEEEEISTDEEEADSSSDDSTKNDSAEESEEELIPTLEDRIHEACLECSALYIPFGSMLSDQMSIISSIAVENKVVTVGGDTTIGQSTLVTLFYDPYDLGYSAGKKAVKLLTSSSDISKMKITYGTADNSVKLYNQTIAKEFEMDFPKSFSEINQFLATYEYGSVTKRHTAQVEE